MKTLKFSLILFAFFINYTAFAAENGEQSKKFGDFTVYYNSFTSSMLSAKVANQYGIPRANNVGVINISVRQGESDNSSAVSAFISGSVKNLLSQQTPLVFNKIEESMATYYIATFTFNNQENLTFEINMVPETEKKQYTFKFSNALYID